MRRRIGRAQVEDAPPGRDRPAGVPGRLEPFGDGLHGGGITGAQLQRLVQVADGLIVSPGLGQQLRRALMCAQPEGDVGLRRRSRGLEPSDRRLGVASGAGAGGARDRPFRLLSGVPVAQRHVWTRPAQFARIWPCGRRRIKPPRSEVADPILALD